LDPGRVIAELEDGAQVYGVAVDLGTTTAVASLWDLIKGTPMGTVSATNIQNIYGADVISRITYCAENEKGLLRLQEKAVQLINGLVDDLCSEAGIAGTGIYRLTVVGNTTMTHLLAGLDPTGLAQKPFTPVVLRGMELAAQDLGIRIAARAQIHILPNIAAFLGSDVVAVVLAARLNRGDSYRLAIDIGTNGEIILAGRGQMAACSTAAGPAFEGARIKYGMRAALGAIEKVTIGDDVLIETIGGHKARGICGSGLIDAVAEMVKAGIIDPGGKIIAPDQAGHLPPGLLKRLGREESGTYFILAFPEDTALDGSVKLTQKDVRELQLAKGAIKAGIQILLAEQGVTLDDLDQVLLAGAFGNYINPASALAIGLFPPVKPDKIESVGNAAGLGAQMALLSESMREEAENIARAVKHIDLSSHKDFQKLFIDALGLK